MTQTDSLDTGTQPQDVRDYGVCRRTDGGHRGESRACILQIVGGVAMLAGGLALLIFT